MKKIFLYGIILLVMLSVAIVGVRAIPAENGTCVIGPNRGSSAESLGQGVENQASGVCDATAEGGCGACLEQCAPFKKIKDLYGCGLCAEDDWCNPECAVGEDADCCDGPVCEDQVNDVGASISSHCDGEPMSLFQSFTPSASPLTAVDLRLRVGGSFPDEGYYTTIKIRSGTPSGDVLGTATTFVPDPHLTGTQLVVNFELPEIEVIPENTYVIEWVSPSGVILGWMVAENDPYLDGTAFGCTGIPISYRDFIFITYTTG